MNVYEQLQKMIEQENSQDTLKEILAELREIKKLLSKEYANTKQKRYNKKSQEYYDFVYKLRKELRADVNNNKFPEISFNNQRLGINYKGWMYDKETTLELSAKEAFKVYEYLYENRDNLDNLIKKWYNIISLKCYLKTQFV